MVVFARMFFFVNVGPKKKKFHSEKGVEKPKHVVVVMLVSQFLELDLCELGQSQFSWFL